MKVIQKHGNEGIAEISDNKIEVRLDLLPDAKVGDYVIVHAGFAIQKLDEAEAEETLKLLREIAEQSYENKRASLI